MQNKRPPSARRGLQLLKVVSYASIAIGAIVLVCLIVLLLFPDPFLNKFIKPRITKAFAKAIPTYLIRIGEMNYNVFKNRLGIDSVALSAVDSTFIGNMGSLSVSGIGWMHLLWAGTPPPNDIVKSIVDAQDIVLSFPKSHYDLHCERLHVSVPDSEIIAEVIDYHPSDDEEQFFAESIFRKARVRLIVPHARVIGVAFLELLQGKSYRARSAQIQDVFLDVLINKDKPFVVDTTSRSTPNKILASIKGTLRLDSLSIMNGRLKYGERFAIGSKPGLITFDNIQVSADGIANHGDRDASIVIRAQGSFLKAGTMKLLMTIPIVSPDFSYKYSGSLSGMDISALNSFLEAAEQIRIKSGVVQSAAFEIDVDSGNARGNVRAVYENLSFAAINKVTGSEKGFSDRAASFIANTFKIRGTNIPDKSGSIKIGAVKFTYKPDNTFFGFSWFALRSGLKDLLSYP